MILGSQIVGQVTVLGAEAADAKLLGVGASADKAQARFGALAAIGSGLLVAGLAAVAIKTGEMAGTFEQAVVRLNTGAGDVTDSFATLSSGILKVSVATGVLSGPLTKAMYEILSSGQRGAKAFDTLSAAAKGAVIEQANVVDVSDTLAGAMTNYGTKVFNASAFMNGLIKAVSLGRVSLQDLSVTMGPIEPVAHAMGISFADLAAAMSTQTNAAIPAARAATGLRFMMQALEVPTSKASDAMKKWGLDTVAVADEMKVSLPGALQMIYDAAKKAGPEGSVPFNRAVSDMVGGQRSLSTFLALTGDHMKAFKDNASAIASSMKSGKGEVSGWALAQIKFNVILDKGKAVAEAAAIVLGTKLLPIFGSIVSGITPVIGKFADFVSGLNAGSPALAIMGGVLAGLAVVIYAAVVPSILAAATAFGALTIAGAPVWIVMLAVIAVVTALILVFQHWGQITDWLRNVWGGFASWVGNLFSAMGTKIHDILTGVKDFIGQKFSDMGTAIHDKLTDIKNAVGQKFSDMGTAVHDSITKTTTGVVDAFHWMYDHNTYVKALVDANKVLFSAMGTFIHDKMTWIKETVGSIFSSMGTFAHDKMVWTRDTVGGLFSSMGTYARDRATDLKNWVGDRFSQLGANVHRTVAGLWSDVTLQFIMAWSKISGPLQDVWNNISRFFTNLAGSAYNWGVNLIQGFLNGVGSMAQNIANTIGGVANNIAGFLGFHSPAKMGPAHDADTWMPNMMKMFTQGITQYTPQFQAALSAVVIKPQALGAAPNNYSGLAYRAGAGSAPTIINNITVDPVLTMDGVRVSRQLMPHVHRAILYNVGGFGV